VWGFLSVFYSNRRTDWRTDRRTDRSQHRIMPLTQSVAGHNDGALLWSVIWLKCKIKPFCVKFCYATVPDANQRTHCDPLMRRYVSQEISLKKRTKRSRFVLYAYVETVACTLTMSCDFTHLQRYLHVQRLDWFMTSHVSLAHVLSWSKAPRRDKINLRRVTANFSQQ